MNKQWSKEQTQKSNKHVKFVLDFIRIQEKKKKNTLCSENKEACPHKL